MNTATLQGACPRLTEAILEREVGVLHSTGRSSVR
jgi:hypothetical protein